MSIFGHTHHRPQFVWGTDKDILKDHPQLKGFPPGKLRLRLRPDEPVTAVVVKDGTARQFMVCKEGDHWVPGPEIARNQAVQSES